MCESFVDKVGFPEVVCGMNGVERQEGAMKERRGQLKWAPFSATPNLNPPAIGPYAHMERSQIFGI